MSQTAGFSTTSMKPSEKQLPTLTSLSLVLLDTSSITSSGTSLQIGMLS